MKKLLTFAAVMVLGLSPAFADHNHEGEHKEQPKVQTEQSVTTQDTEKYKKKVKEKAADEASAVDPEQLSEEPQAN